MGLRGPIWPNLAFKKSLDEPRPCRRPLPKLNPKSTKTRTSKKTRFLVENGAPRDPKKHEKSQKNGPRASQKPLGESFALRSPKKWFPRPAQDLPMCLQHSKYHGFNTFHKVPPGTLLGPFGLHFGSLGAALETQNAQRMRKRDTPKKHRKMIPQKCRKVAKITSKMGWVKLTFYSFFENF